MIRYIKSTKFYVKISELHNTVDYCGRFSFDLRENIQRLFLIPGEFLMTETSERQKNCVNICISKQLQRYHAFSQVEKEIMIFRI